MVAVVDTADAATRRAFFDQCARSVRVRGSIRLSVSAAGPDYGCHVP